MRKLKRDADRALAGGNYSVTDKTTAPPSDNKHDYMSLAPYWWPNPDTPNGLPYIRRDGEINPERDQTSDRKRLGAMIYAVTTLAIAYFFTDSDKYANRAVELLRFWFLNDASRMTPHLQYAQAVPGRSQGRGAGIIETHDLPYLLDAVALLSHSPLWTKSDHEQRFGLRRIYNGCGKAPKAGMKRKQKTIAVLGTTSKSLPMRFLPHRTSSPKAY